MLVAGAGVGPQPQSAPRRLHVEGVPLGGAPTSFPSNLPPVAASHRRLTMAIMFVGACLLTGAYGPTDQIFLSVFWWVNRPAPVLGMQFWKEAP